MRYPPTHHPIHMLTHTLDHTLARSLTYTYSQHHHRYTDVNDSEKDLMKLWSGWVLDYPVGADAHVAPMCKDFISENRDRLVALRNNLIMHIATLREFAIISLSETAELIAHANVSLGV
jgi:hypothetical protein